METLTTLTLIFRDQLIPIFILVVLGWLVQQRLGLDMRTLSRINIYIFVPALTLRTLATARLTGSDLIRVAAFVLLLQALLLFASRLWCRWRRYPESLTASFGCSVIFYNSGNFGYPLMVLLYGADSVAVGLQTIVLVVQNLTTFSVGQVLLRGARLGAWRALLEYFKLPYPYTIALALAIQFGLVPRPPAFLWHSVELAADGLVAVALVTLGAQLGTVRWQGALRPVFAACAMRLLGGPLLAFCLVKLLGWNGLLAQQLLISSAVPTAVNTTLLALEFGGEADFASQTVMFTTLAAAISVALSIYAAQILFPIPGALP